ncbi:MAG: RHS repeat-associated core domain-containing protein [Terriglobia bacterium]|nr:RHS repeat-associated core domain-containing protein [Terriglobia bacterium]
MLASAQSRSSGKERDSETGLDYFGARYYGSNMGRWMSPDWSDAPEPVPYADLTDPQTLNLYHYVRNNPLSGADQTGHDCPPDCGWVWEGIKQTASDAIVGGGQGLANIGITTYDIGADLLNTQTNGASNLPIIQPYIPMTPGEDTAQHGANIVATLATLSTAVKGTSSVEAGGEAVSAGSASKATQLKLNQAAGNAYRDEVADSLKAAGRDVQKEVVKQTPFGNRRVDIEASHNGKTLGGIETKTGNSPYKPSQRAKDTYLKQKGYPVNVVRKPKPKEQ